jgi:glutathione S-transferase
MAAPKIILATWGIRPGGEHGRLAFEFSGITNYEVKRYYSAEEWAKDAPKVGVTALPYLQVGDRIITHAYAILQWAAEHPGSKVVGANAEDRVAFWEYAAPLTEMTLELAAGSTEPGFVEVAKKRVQDRVRPFLTTVSKWLGDKDFFLGYPSLADIDLFELLEYSNGLDSTILTNIEPNLIAFHKRFLALPEVVAYRASPRFQDRPLLCKDV